MKKNLKYAIIPGLMGLSIIVSSKPVFAKNVKINNPITISSIANTNKDLFALRSLLNNDIPNYSLDEKEIKDYNNKERYRNTQLEQGNGTSANFNNNNKRDEFIDGYRYNNAEPNSDSPDRTKWGFEIEFDKEKGQRTYTNFGFTNGGLMGSYLDTGSITANDAGKKLADDPSFKTPNYKAATEIEIAGSRNQRNLNAYVNEEDLKHINSIDNNNTIMVWEAHYKIENPNRNLRATEGTNAAFSFSVNPWPDENDKLNKIKLNGTYDEKVYIKGQDIKTKIKIDNLDESARERLVGQVYNPVTGEVVKEADAYIDNEGYVHIKMPDGVINEDGTENKDSIFNTPEYKGLQNLDVKFFARPRTKTEFENIAKIPGEFDETGIYTETGAGTKTINHKGEKIEIDLQGIDRYDHYNLIGSFKLQLDDTRYYDQNFLGSDKQDASTHTSIPIKPGEDFNVKIYLPENQKDNKNQKSDLDILSDQEKGILIGKIDKKYVENYNKGKKDIDKWIIKDDDITKFTISAPKTAKAGDFMAVPIEYTYTNGSKDTHWFHFVVQDSDNNIPNYQTKVGLQGEELISDANISNSEEAKKKNQPISYELIDDEFIDSEGNKWENVSINSETGQIKTTVPKNVKINGGEILTVKVKVKYKDESGTEKEEIVNSEFVARPKYDGEFTYAEKQEIPFETKIEFDANLKAGEKQITQKGELGERSREITQKYENDKMLDQIVGEFKITKKPKEEIIKVGSMTNGTHQYKEEIPFEYIVKEDPKLQKGQWVEDVKGVKGERTTTWNIVNSKIVGEPNVKLNKSPVNAVIRVGKGEFRNTITLEDVKSIQYETKIELDNTLPSGKIEITGGEVGEEKRNIELTIVDGVVNKKEGKFIQTKAPINKIIKVGSKTEGTHSYEENIPFETKVEKNPELKKGEWRYKKINNIEQTGQLGKKKTTWIIENSKITEKPNIEIIKDPIDAVIEVGDEDFTGVVKHQVTEEKAFNVEIIENPNMIAGKFNIKQEGVKGKIVTEYSQNIKNGQANGKMTSREISNKPAVNQIIEIGTSHASNDKDITSETSVKIEYIYDNTLDKGIVKNGELIKGKVVTEVINEYDPETGKIQTVEETKVKDAIQKIIIGTKDYTGEFKYTENFKIPYSVEVKTNANLPAGQYKTIQEGKEGSYNVDYLQKIKNGRVDGKLSKTENNKIEPKNHIIEIGTMPAENDRNYDKDVTVKVEYIYDNSKNKGVVETGKLIPGKVETKIINKYDPKTGKVITTEEEVVTEAIQQIIVGSRNFTGEYEFEHTEKIPFEVEIKQDPTMKKGESKISQKGEAGEKYYKYTQNLKDGQADGEKNVVEEKTIKEPIKEIILIGSGSIEGETTRVVKRKIPFETKVIYNENLEVGNNIVENEGKPGEEEVTIKVKSIDGKMTETEDVKKISDKEDRIVKIGVKPIEKEIETGFNTIYKYNKDLADGEINTITEGINGKIVNNIFFNKKTGKIEITEERVEPIDKVVEYGSKTEGKVSIESDIPFEIEVIKDDTLKVGEIKVDQEGELGKKETIITIENSEEVDKEENIIKEPIKKIVRVGTYYECPATNPDEPTGPIEPEKPIEPNKPNKPNQPIEEQPNQPKEPKKTEDTPTTPKVPEKPVEPKEPQNPNKNTNPEKPIESDDKILIKPRDKEKDVNPNVSYEPKKPTVEPIESKDTNRPSTIKGVSKDASDDNKESSDNNVKTGVTGAGYAAITALLSGLGLHFTNKKKK